MNLQNDPQSFALMKFGIGQPVLRSEDPMLVRGEGRYTDDIKLAGPGLCGDGAQPPSPTASSSGIDTDGRAHDAGRARRLYRRRPRRLRHAQMHRAVQEPRRHADEASRRGRRCRPTRCASSAIRSPSSSPRPLLQAKDAAEAVEVDIEPLPAVTEPERRGAPGRAAASTTKRRATSRSTTTSATPRRWRRPSPRPRMSPAQARQQPRGRQRDGAARGDRRLRSGERALHAAAPLARACSACGATSRTFSRSSRSRCAS